MILSILFQRLINTYSNLSTSAYTIKYNHPNIVTFENRIEFKVHVELDSTANIPLIIYKRAIRGNSPSYKRLAPEREKGRHYDSFVEAGRPQSLEQIAITRDATGIITIILSMIFHLCQPTRCTI